MLKSMTGYGKNTCEYAGKKFTVEIKSLNSKQLDLNVKLPAPYKEKEIFLRNEINKFLSRGKVDFSIYSENGDSDKTLVVNSSLLKTYYQEITKVIEECGHKVHDEHIFNSLLRLPDVFRMEQTTLNEEEWTLIWNTTEKTLNLLNEFRIQEGKALEKDIRSRVSIILNKLTDVDKFEKQRIEIAKNRIRTNLTEVLTGASIDENRFEQELIYYLEKIDVTEEKVRLKNHCTYFIETIENEEEPGRKLGFIAQEMGREINTLGSKANDSEIQKLVVQMKDELEKIKEQILNVL